MEQLLSIGSGVYDRRAYCVIPHSATSLSPWKYIRNIGFGELPLNRVALSYLPASDTEKESEDIGLLLLLQLLDI